MDPLQDLRAWKSAKGRACRELGQSERARNGRSCPTGAPEERVAAFRGPRLERTVNGQLPQLTRWASPRANFEPVAPMGIMG